MKVIFADLRKLLTHPSVTAEWKNPKAETEKERAAKATYRKAKLSAWLMLAFALWLFAPAS